MVSGWPGEFIPCLIFRSPRARALPTQPETLKIAAILNFPFCAPARDLSQLIPELLC